MTSLAQSPPALSELARRVLFAVVAAPATVYLIYLGGIYLGILCAIAAALGAWELFRIARAGGVDPIDSVGIPFAALLPILASRAPRGVFGLNLGASAVAVLIMFTLAIWLRGAGQKPLSAVAVTLFGVVYTGGMLSFGIALRNYNYTADRLAGTLLLLLPILLTWMNDIGAYALGRLFGHRKLMPSVSPGKTVAGAVGGIIVAVIFCWAYVKWILAPYAELGMASWAVVVVALALSLAAQVGDLAESLLKREAGVKNSSGLIPGHGGVLDRLDSLLFVLPTAYLLFGIPGILLPVPR
ncbi:MAG TPA: phosphatidate cytidylyltransferase [Gemmatimonadaceae bacterium]|nr:phosphatidate cytidylyltransferase [Gemmatimonadaceae bacterium]